MKKYLDRTNKFVRPLSILVITILITGCSPLERQAYGVIVGAKAFLDSIKKAHTECGTAQGMGTNLCIDLQKATSAKDVMIDLVEVYCSNPVFDLNGGQCVPPTDKTVKTQLSDKINAAIRMYQQTESDIKGVIH